MDLVKGYLSPYKSAYSWCGDHGAKVATTIGVSYVVLILYRFKRVYTSKVHLRNKRLKKQMETRKTIESLKERVMQSNIKDEKVNEICTLSLNKLNCKLQNGELKSIDVLRSYQKKALQVNKKTNAIVDVVREAEALALECDQMTDRSSRPLHGLPISIKDNFPMAGYDSILGFSEFIDKPYAEDAALIKVLKHQGAVPFVRTNVPQTTLSYDTCNPVFGQTYNPYGKGRSPGGSSGGEAALIAGGGSPVGLGGDIGGSIRIPAAFCGVCGFKPTSSRLSGKKTNPILKGQNIITAAYGPLGRDVDSLVLIMRALLCQYHFDLDNTVPPLPFNEEVYKQTKRLRIGFYLQDNFMTSVPSMQRAVNISVDALRKIGHEVIQWEFPKFGHRSAYLWSKAIGADGGAELLSLLKHDESDHSFIMTRRMFSLNRTLFKLIMLILKKVYPRMHHMVQNLQGIDSVPEYQNAVRQILKFREEVEEDLKSKNIDILLAPGFAMPAPPVGAHKYCTGATAYTGAMNVLNFPAGTLPVTTVSEEDIAQMADYPTPDPWHKTIKKSMEGAEGLPVGVQVIGLPYHEETTLRIMKELETALQK